MYKRQSPTRSNAKISEDECLKKLQDFLEKHPCINRADYCAITGMSRLKALHQLNLFIEKGIIQKCGNGKTVDMCIRDSEMVGRNFGTISVRSTVGEGSCFTVTFPSFGSGEEGDPDA